MEILKKLFGDDCFVEITHHPEIDGHEEQMKKIIELARDGQVELVAAHDTYYLKPEDSVARELVTKIRTGGILSRDFEQGATDFSFITQATANRLFKDTPEAIDNTVKIADRCNVELKLGSWLFPDFPIPPGTTHDSELRDLVYKGFEWRHIERTPEIVERVDYELSVISNKGYSPYFPGRLGSPTIRQAHRYFHQHTRLGGRLARIVSFGHHDRQSVGISIAVRTFSQSGAPVAAGY